MRGLLPCLLLSAAYAALTDPAAVVSAPQARTPAALRLAVDRARLMADLRALADPSLKGRRTGSPGAGRARAYITEQFELLGLEPAGTSGFLQPFPAAGELPAGANVIARRAGTGRGSRVLVIAAHFDHLGVIDGRVYPGADDNASGVAALLAVARHLQREQPRHTVYLAAFDAEEQGLRGSSAFVASALVPRGRIALNVNLDMVSRSDGRELFISGSRYNPWLEGLLDPVRQRSAVRVRYGHDGRQRGDDDWTLQSDHAAFHRAGVPFAYFGVEDHADYHQPGDTIERIDPGFFGDAVDTILDAVVTLDRTLPERAPSDR